MRLDEIINRLYILQSCESEGSRMETLIDLVVELAHHVKAQEPEPIEEEEIIDYMKQEEKAEENKELGAAIRKVAHGLKG